HYSCCRYVSVLFVSIIHASIIFYFFFFNDTPTTEIYTLSLHDALPIFSSHAADTSRPCSAESRISFAGHSAQSGFDRAPSAEHGDRKSTRLNSSHQIISYAVFCLKKKKTQPHIYRHVNNTQQQSCLHLD